MLTPIEHKIPEHLMHCVRVHRIKDEELIEVTIGNRAAVKRAVKCMPFGKRWSRNDLKKHLDTEMVNETIRAHLANLVLAGVLVTVKVGENRYYVRVS
jgi:hypothetical protein